MFHLRTLSITAALVLAIATRVDAQPTVLTGGTVIDVANFGRSDNDIPNAAIVLDQGRVVSVKPLSATVIPRNARVVDIRGKYVLPGFCDSFVGIHDQKTANALLYMGVTSGLSGPSPQPDGTLGYFEPVAGPRPFRRAMITGRVSFAGLARGDTNIPRFDEKQLLEQLDKHVKSGIRAFHLALSLRPEETAVVLRRTRELRLATIGELANRSYADALRQGIQALVHTTRYTLALMPEPVRAAMAADPLGWGTARGAFFKALRMTDPSSATVEQFARRLASSGTALVPTLSVTLDEGAVETLPPDDPVLQILGAVRAARANATERPQIPAASKADLLNIERAFVKAGVRYLTGAGDRLGQVAGRSLHTELRLLVGIGLTPRQALAAATSNFDSVYGWREVGLIKPGFRADLLILAASPLLDISSTTKIHAVYFDGARVDREGMVSASRD